MDFNLTSEQQMFQDSVRAFAERELKPGAHARAHSQDYPYDAAKKLAGQGLLGITIPEDKGGQGGSLFDAVLAIEQIASTASNRLPPWPPLSSGMVIPSSPWPASFFAAS